MLNDFQAWGGTREWHLIRPLQIKGISDQTISDRFNPRSDWCALKTFCMLELSSKIDPSTSLNCESQIFLRPLSTFLCAQNYLWSDNRVLESHAWSDWYALEPNHDQTEMRLKFSLIRAEFARNCLWSGLSALEIGFNEIQVSSK